MNNTRELSFFIRELLKIPLVQDVLENRIGVGKKNQIINHFNNTSNQHELNIDFEDIIEECVDNESTIHNTLIGIGDYGEFPIYIMNFGPLFWVSGQEFDAIKYFETAEDAISYAEWEYQSFL